MLENMYSNFSKGQDWRFKRVDFTPGDTMGMKNVEVEIEGEYVFGMLRGEQGTHRLVRVWNGKRQNVNKVSTAVRLKHLPTGITQECREERSQLANRTKALKRLTAKLVAVQQQQQVEKIEAIRGDLVEAQWGAQIRNYVLQPYTMVKDLRSGHERGDADRVLNGDISSHIDAYL